MAGPYDLYPSVDSNYNFPPIIRTALLASSDVRAALDASRDAAVAVAVPQAVAQAATAMGRALTGMVNAFAGGSAPAGWLICDGTAISRTAYSELFAVIGVTYGGGDGTSTFNLPNMKGRIPVGIDANQSEFSALAQTGGEKAHKLTIAELASHTHTQNAHNHGVNDPGHNHSQNAHGHGINDPGHGHGVSDPGHGHGVNDPGHSHGSSSLDGFMTYRTNAAFRRQTATSSSTGYYSIMGNTINDIDYGRTSGSGVGIGINGSGTGIGIYGSGTGVGVQNTTASNNASGTGIGLSDTTASNQNTGGDGSHNNLQPYVALNYIIHV